MTGGRGDSMTGRRGEGEKEDGEMHVPRFSFKSEAYWILIFSLAPAALGLLVFLIALLMRWFRQVS